MPADPDPAYVTPQPAVGAPLPSIPTWLHDTPAVVGTVRGSVRPSTR